MTTGYISRAVLFVAFLATASSAFANPIDELRQTVNRAPLSTDSLESRQGIEIAAGTEKEQVSLEIGQSQGEFIWNAKLSAPIDKSKKQGELANLDGLSDAIRLSATVKIFRGQPDFADSAEMQVALFASTYETCVKAARLKEERQPETFVKNKCNDSTGLFELSEMEIQKLELTRTQIAERKKQLKVLEREYDCLLWSAKPDGDCRDTFRVYAATATIGSEEFEFFDSMSLAKSKQDETEFSVELSATFLRIPSSAFLRAAYRRERVFKASPNQLFCQPLAPSAVLTCQNLSGGPPVKKNRDILSIEARKRVLALQNTTSPISFGISPKVSYDLEDDVLGIDVPIYFIPDKDGNLTGGLNIGWRDDTNDLAVGIFVGSTFTIFQ